jgi:hypothetical protein
MIWFIYIVGGLFIALACAMFYVFYRNQHFGMFLMGVTYSASGVLAIGLPHWWPLLAGFVLVWLLRFMGLVPDVAPPAEEKRPGGEGEGGAAADEGRGTRDEANTSR